MGRVVCDGLSRPAGRGRSNTHMRHKRERGGSVPKERDCQFSAELGKETQRESFEGLFGGGGGAGAAFDGGGLSC